MIAGIGIDLVEIARVAEKVEKNNGFTELVFSEKEIALCKGKSKPFESFAARFAAKEAFLKSLGTGLDATFELHQIEVLSNTNGQPYLQLSAKLWEMVFHLHGPNQAYFHVSLTHTAEYASATVILEIREK